MKLLPTHSSGLRRVVDVKGWGTFARPAVYYRHLPHEGRGMGDLACRWSAVMLGVARAVHSTEAIELGDRAGTSLVHGQDVNAVLAPVRREPDRLL